jgi:hypothetical protein
MAIWFSRRPFLKSAAFAVAAAAGIARMSQSIEKATRHFENNLKSN